MRVPFTKETERLHKSSKLNRSIFPIFLSQEIYFAKHMPAP